MTTVQSEAMQPKPKETPNETVRKIAFRLVWLWLTLRLLTWAAVILYAPLNAFTELEKRIPYWPPSGNFAAWLGRFALAPWLRWDAWWYQRTLVEGYTAGNGTTSFHPLYTLVSWPLYRLGLDPLLSLLVTGSLATLALFWIFYKLARLDLPPAEATTAVLFLAVFPVSFILFAPYTESLFLLLAAAALYTMRQRRWGWTALLCFLATLTRQQGLFLCVPLAWWAWESSGRSLRGIKKAWRGWLALLAAPAALLAFSAYRIGILHESQVDFSSLQNLIYSAVFSPSNYAVVAGQGFRWPWQALAIGFSKLVHHPELNIAANLTLGLAFAAGLLAAWKHLNWADRLYCLTVAILSFSFTTGEIGYMSLPRHLMAALPAFIGLAAALRTPRQKLVLVAIQLPLMFFLLMAYVLTTWIP